MIFPIKLLQLPTKTAGFRRGVNEIFVLLECSAALTDGNRRFGKAYRSLTA